MIGDHGLVTLREAIEAANTNTAVFDAPAGTLNLQDVITFSPAVFLEKLGPAVLNRTEVELLLVIDNLYIQGRAAMYWISIAVRRFGFSTTTDPSFPSLISTISYNTGWSDYAAYTGIYSHDAFMNLTG